MLKQRAWMIAVLQSFLVLASVILAWCLRFEFSFPNRDLLFSTVPLLLLLRAAAMARFGLFHGYWRYAGASDAADVVKAVGVGSLAFVVALRYVLHVTAFPVSIYVLEAIFTIVLLGGVRLVLRTAMQAVEVKQRRRRKNDPPGRVLVIGAGGAAELLIRDLPRHGYTPVGCVDDDQGKRGARIHGIRVLGTIDEIPELVDKHSIDELLIAIPSASGVQMRRIVDISQKSTRKFKIVPGLSDLVEGKVTVGQLREVKLEDLLGRDPVRMNLEGVSQALRGKTVMVTGAAGSIGSELCRQILGYGPEKLICLDQAETPMFYLQLALAKHEFASRVAYCVADITDTAYLRNVFLQHGVNIIFHAAAYKHVPLMETNLAEALKNNVFALISLLEQAERCGCESFVLISSDKAVHPTSFMGCTKRIGELIVAARPAGAMRYVSVRFGNVLGSQGSVVPLFQEQLRTGQCITITHPDITRFFMTIPEAASLVLQADTVGEHGNVLVLDMGEPIRIVDLARTLIRLSGKSAQDAQIVFTGLRKGEKLYEELFYQNEVRLPTANPKVSRARSETMSWSTLSVHLLSLRAMLHNSTEASIRSMVKEIVPEYSYTLESLAPPVVTAPFTSSTAICARTASVGAD